MTRRNSATRRHGVTRRHRGVLGLVVVGLIVLAGCSPADAGTPPTTPTTTVTVIPTPSPSPTPHWTADEQAAIDAVDAYLAEWSRISQHLDTADWNDIRRVADDPMVKDDLEGWQIWADRGWRLTGAFRFTASRVEAIDATDTIRAFWVDGCRSVLDAHIVDGNGVQVNDGTRQVVVPVTMVVARESDGVIRVMNEAPGSWSC